MFFEVRNKVARFFWAFNMTRFGSKILAQTWSRFLTFFVVILQI